MTSGQCGVVWPLGSLPDVVGHSLLRSSIQGGVDGNCNDTSVIEVGMIAEETGALSFMGRANANVARMVVDEINANGGLLERKIELYVEDGATSDAVAEARAAKLVTQDKVDVIFGGIYSSTRQAIKGTAVVKGRTLYIYPEQYEGQECDPLIFCTGPVPAQQLDPAHSLADAQDWGQDILPAVRRLHLAARDEREGPPARQRRRRQHRRRGILSARSHGIRRNG